MCQLFCNMFSFGVFKSKSLWLLTRDFRYGIQANELWNCLKIDYKIAQSSLTMEHRRMEAKNSNFEQL